MAGSRRSPVIVPLAGGGFIDLPNKPILRNAAPTVTDVYDIGDVWVDQTAQAAHILVAYSGSDAVWKTYPAGASPTFTDVTITPGDLSVANDVTVVGKLALSGAGETHTISGDLTVAGAITVATLTATGTTTIAGDLDLTSAALIDLTSTLNADPCIYLHANGGLLETVHIRASQGTAVDAIKLTAAAGGVTITTGLVSDDSFNVASSGGIDIDGAKQINIATSETDADSFVMSSAGGMDVTIAGAAGKDLDVGCTSGSVNITAGESDADALVLKASGAAGGVKVQTGTSGLELANQADATTIDLGNIAPTVSRTITIGGGQVATGAVADTIDIGVDAVTTEATASKVVNIATGTNDTGTLTVNALSGTVTSGTVAMNVATGTGTKILSFGNADGLTTVNIDGITLINDSIDVATSINTGTSTGAVSIGNALAGAIAIDTASGISLDGATASNFSVTGAGIDLTLASVGGSIGIDASEASATAVVIEASNGAGCVQVKAGSAGVLIGNEADTAVLDLGNIAPTASRTVTIGGGQVATAAVTDTIDIGVDAVTTQATASKIVNIGTGTNDTGTLNVNILSGTVTSGTVAMNLATGTGTKIINTGNADGLTTVNIDGITLINDDIDVATSINTGTSTGSVSIGNALAGAMAVDTASGISLDGATASNFTVTGAGADLTLGSVGGSVVIDGSEASATAVSVTASDVAGGLDFNAGTGGVTLDTTAGFSIDGATASNVTVTGANEDLTLKSTGGSVIVEGTEAVTTAVRIVASDVAGGISLEGDGLTSVEGENVTIASPVVIATVNKNVMDIICTGFTTAAAASETFTITNSKISATSRIVEGCCNEGANDAQMNIKRINRSAGSCVVTITNDGAAALNGNLSFTLWILS